jgi:hypothetical protein
MIGAAIDKSTAITMHQQISRVELRADKTGIDRMDAVGSHEPGPSLKS